MWFLIIGLVTILAFVEGVAFQCFFVLDLFSIVLGVGLNKFIPVGSFPQPHLVQL